MSELTLFSLVSEPWIPVTYSDRTYVEVSLQTLLDDAHKIEEIYADSPVLTIALNRLLLAIVIDAYIHGPDEKVWKQVWRTGYFDGRVSREYFEHYEDRFYLLHPDFPFYQHPIPIASKPSAVSKLALGKASGNNATLFDHSLDQLTEPLSLAEAARHVVGIQSSALGGGNSKPFNLSAAPLVNGSIFWVRGDSLFETLLFNAPPLSVRPVWVAGDGAADPVWARPLPTDYEKRPPAGWLDYLTWQARRLTLVPDKEAGKTVIEGVFLTQGDKDEPSCNDDPLRALRVPRDKAKGRYPYKLLPERAVWRDLDLILSAYSEDEGCASGPRNLEWARVWYEECDRNQIRFDLFSLINDKGKMIAWRHEQLEVPAAIVGSEEILSKIGEGLAFAEDQARNLNDAIRNVARYCLSPPKAGESEPGDVESSDLADVANALNAVALYWSNLELQFFEWLVSLVNSTDLQVSVWEWCETIFKEAMSAFETATSSFNRTARDMRAVAHGSIILRRVKPYQVHLEIIKEATNAK